MSHIGEEVFLVMEGTIVVYLNGYAHELHTGDSISFDSAVPHAYANLTDAPVVFVGSSTPPTVSGCYA
nr:cupin domain-containing protein [Amycolatopsis jejuensis]